MPSRHVHVGRRLCIQVAQTPQCSVASGSNVAAGSRRIIGLQCARPSVIAVFITIAHVVVKDKAHQLGGNVTCCIVDFVVQLFEHI